MQTKQNPRPSSKLHALSLRATQQVACLEKIPRFIAFYREIWVTLSQRGELPQARGTALGAPVNSFARSAAAQRNAVRRSTAASAAIRIAARARVRIGVGRGLTHHGATTFRDLCAYAL